MMTTSYLLFPHLSSPHLPIFLSTDLLQLILCLVLVVVASAQPLRSWQNVDVIQTYETNTDGSYRLR